MSNFKELKTVTRCWRDLQITIHDNLDRVAEFMLVEEIITGEMWSEATDTRSMNSAAYHAEKLLRRWYDKVQVDPSFFTKVVEGHFRQSSEHYRSILSKLDEVYGRQGGSPAYRQKLGELVITFFSSPLLPLSLSLSPPPPPSHQPSYPPLLRA